MIIRQLRPLQRFTVATVSLTLHHSRNLVHVPKAQVRRQTEAAKEIAELNRIKKNLQNPSVIESMKRLRPNCSSMNQKHILKQYMNNIQQCHNHVHAIHWLRKCETDGYQPDLILYTAVINKRGSTFESNIVLFEEMIGKYNIQPNVLTLCSLLKCCANNGLHSLAIYLFSCTKTIQTNHVFAEQLFQDLFDNNDSQQGHEIKIQEISNEYGINSIVLQALQNIELNIVAFTLIMECLSRVKRLDLIITLFHFMHTECHIQPNTVYFNCMFDILVAHKQIGAMERIYDWWIHNPTLVGARVQNAVIPDTITINSLIKGYANSKEFHKSQLLFEKYFAKEETAQKDCEEEEDDAEAEEEAAIVDTKLKPSGMTFVHLIDCAGKSGCVSHALQYYNEMKLIYDIQARDESQMCTIAILDACAKNNDIQNLIQIYDNMSYSLKTKIVFRIVIRCLFLNGLINEAISIFDEGVNGGAGNRKKLTKNKNQKENKKNVSFDAPILTYKARDWSPYSIDLHSFDLCTAIIAILYNFRRVIEDLSKSKLKAIPEIYVITGKGSTLKPEIPAMLANKALFNPPIKAHCVDPQNDGLLQLDHESVVCYIQQQLQEQSSS